MEWYIGMDLGGHQMCGWHLGFEGRLLARDSSGPGLIVPPGIFRRHGRTGDETGRKPGCRPVQSCGGSVSDRPVRRTTAGRCTLFRNLPSALIQRSGKR
jgi:hypothetical protein